MNNSPVRAHVRVCGAAIALALGVVGCAPKGAPPRNKEPTREHLLLIGEAYRQAEDALKRAPRNADDITAYIDADEPDKVLTSPRDHQRYIILWGTETLKMGMGKPPTPPRSEKDKGKAPQGSTPPVLAYERDGADGKRFVLFATGRIVAMNVEDFKKTLEGNAIQPKGSGTKE
jgi:hypothetical protein